MADVPVVTLPKVATVSRRTRVMTGEGASGPPAGDSLPGVVMPPADVPAVRLPKVATPLPRAAVADDTTVAAPPPGDVPVARLPKVATPRSGTTTQPTSTDGTGAGQPIALDATGDNQPKTSGTTGQTPTSTKGSISTDGGRGQGRGTSDYGAPQREPGAAGAAAWTWLLPLALLGLGGIWWLFDGMSTRTHIAQLTERLGHESGVRAKTETALAKAVADAAAATAGAAKARADLDTASASLRREVDARRSSEGKVASLESRLDAETKQRIELESRLGRGIAVDGKDLADARSAVDDLRRELGVETQRRAGAEQALAGLRGDTDTTMAALRSDLETEKRRASSEAAARKTAEDEAATLRLQLKQPSGPPDAGKLADALQSIAQLGSQLATEQTARRNDVATLKQQVAAELSARQQAEAELKAAQGRVASASAGASELLVCRDAFKAATASGPIEFEFASATITRASAPTLDRVAQAIRKCPWADVRVEGHTDSRGSLERNTMWSQSRAKAVVDYLSRQPGIDASRLTPIGYAHLYPLDRSGTPEAEARNRRIDFVIVVN